MCPIPISQSGNLMDVRAQPWLVTDSGASRFCRSVVAAAIAPAQSEIAATPSSRMHAAAPLACARGRAKATLVLAAHGPKLRNFGVCTCEHQNYLASDRWCSHGRDQSYVTLAPTSVGTNGHRRGVLVLAAHGPKLRNFGAHTCRPQCVPDRVDFGVCRCQHQSYVTLALTSVGSNPG